MEGIEDAGCVLELIVDGVLSVPGRDPPSRSGYRSETVRRARPASSHARCQTCLGPGPLKRAVGCSSPRVRSTMPVSSREPGGVGPGGAIRARQPPVPEPPQKRAGSSDAACRHGLIWDHTVFHVVASYRARPAIVAPSKRNCRIAQRITRTPKRARVTHTEWFCSMKVTIRQVRSRHIQRRLNHQNLAGTPAQGASITSTTTRPWPCAIQPATRAPRQLVARLNIEHQSIWGASHAHQMEALQTDEQITPIKRHTAAGRARHRPRSLKTARVEVR